MDRRFTGALAAAWAVAHVLYPLDYFGLPGAENLTGADVWPTSFASKVDRVPAALLAVFVLAGLVLGAGLAAGAAVGRRDREASAAP